MAPAQIVRRCLVDGDPENDCALILEKSSAGYVQYRTRSRIRRFTTGPHSVSTPETARQEARVLLGCVAQAENSAEEREREHTAISVKELCRCYQEDIKSGLFWENAPPKEGAKTYTDEGRIRACRG